MSNSSEQEKFKLRLYQYILRLIKFLVKLPQNSVIIEIIRQVMDSGTSVGANYFEARAASSRKDYTNFFTHALKSANETKS